MAVSEQTRGQGRERPGARGALRPRRGRARGALRAGGAGALLLVSSLLAAGCARVLGDVILEPLLPAPDAGTAGRPGTDGAGAGDLCEPGQLRCNGQLLEACVSSVTERSASWRTFSDCLAGNRCVLEPEPGCINKPCSTGEVSCDEATPRVCNAAQDGWSDLPACVSAAHCSADPGSCAGAAPCCLPAPCTAGEMRCNQGEMQRCNDTETAWDSVARCDTTDLCLAGLNDCGGSGTACACQAAECQATETRCIGTALEHCNAGRTGWDPVGVCASAALCEQGRALVPAACVPPECEVGDHVCTPAGVLQACRVDRTGYDLQEPCEGPQFCDASAGLCNPVACESGDRRCNGAQIEVCLQDRTGFRPDGFPCATAELCDDSDPGDVRCNPPVCDVSEFDCFGGTQLQVCNAGRTAFQPVGAACPRPDLCSAARRRCDFCVPNRQECTPELDASRVCSATGNSFGPETSCPLGCDGPLGACRTCTVGSYRCNGNVIARCNDARSFTPLNRATDCSGATQLSCNNGQLSQVACGAVGCSAQRALCNECSGTQRQCVGATGFRQCAGGVFGATTACAAGLTCSGAGNCGCTPGSPRCNGGTLQACNGQGTGFVATGDFCEGDVLLSCAAGTLTRIQCVSIEACEASDGLSCE